MDLTKEQKTTNGKVLPKKNSSRPPRNVMRPPIKKYTAVSLAPLPPAPRHPIRSHESGVIPMRKPRIANGVGLPEALSNSDRSSESLNVYRKSFSNRPSQHSACSGRFSRTGQERFELIQLCGSSPEPGRKTRHCEDTLRLENLA